MSRESSDELAPDGTILNGFDYHLQCWVKGGKVVKCGHNHTDQQYNTCQAFLFAGKQVRDVPGHEVRPAPCHTIHCRHYGLPYGRPCEVEAIRKAQHART